MNDYWNNPPEYFEDDHCPRCGEHENNMSFEDGDETTEWYDEGFCSVACYEEWQTDDCYDNLNTPRSKRITDEQRDRLADMFVQARKAKENAYSKAKKNLLTPDQIFEYADPEGDFEWRDEEAGDWHVYCCGDKDCPIQWHTVAYSTDIGRKDGKRFVELSSVDSDGNWDFDIGWKEGFDFHDVALTLQTQITDYFFGWFEYWAEVAITGNDILGNCNLEKPTVGDFIEFAEDNLKYLEM